ncbi:uncharacterized protein LOC122242429 [Penaeus japonicus]|uniref:uncharacterized protein LOC122242429 n=1 Tax=Penaeus japonicus TaxID=27405 RepID=UPI001C714D46|nr:uncharacterized protein LOC122242429 [Penaeus japonicus]
MYLKLLPFFPGRVCTIQDPLAAAVSFDGTVSTVSDTSCSYSAVQDGYSYNPDSYVYVDFDAHPTVSGFVDRTEHVFKDTGADPVTCPADDIQGCSFGPVTDKPKEINDVGTLALTTQLGSLTFNAILGVNQITTLYTDDTLLIFAPVSKFDELGGLCGEYNGDPADDLTIRDETVTTDAAAFVTDWKTDPNCVSTPARSMLRYHDQTSLCSGVPQETVSGFEGMCQDIISPHMNITDLAKDECLQILCICNDRDIGACEASLEEWFTTLGIVDQRKKDPLDLAIELQSAFL